MAPECPKEAELPRGEKKKKKAMVGNDEEDVEAENLDLGDSILCWSCSTIMD